MARLGGQTVDLNPQVTQLGRGEPLEDTARVLSRYCDVLAVRTFAQQELVDYAHWATVPVINALTDLEHPCQSLAHFLTMREAHGDLPGQTLAYIGDGNNVAHSLMLCGALLGVNVRIGCPQGFEPLPGEKSRPVPWLFRELRSSSFTIRVKRCGVPRRCTPMCGHQWGRKLSKQSGNRRFPVSAWMRR